MGRTTISASGHPATLVEDRLFTGDTLLIGATGRTDLPTGDAEALYASLFEGILQRDADLKVFPAHEYREEWIRPSPRSWPRTRACSYQSGKGPLSAVPHYAVFNSNP